MAGENNGGALQTVTHPGDKPLRQFGKEIFQSISDDDIFGRAAQLAYYFFFSIFPGFIFLSSLPGVSYGGNGGIRGALLQHLTAVIPPSAYPLLQQTFNQSGSHGG